MKNNKPGNYIDLYLLPLPKENLEKYKVVARKFGKLAKKHGALDYREFEGDDLTPEGTLSFTKASKIAETEILITAVVSFNSRKHRDIVMKKMFSDPWMLKMEKESKEEPLANMKKMYYGGFKTIVNI